MPTDDSVASPVENSGDLLNENSTTESVEETQAPVEETESVAEDSKSAAEILQQPLESPAEVTSAPTVSSPTAVATAQNKTESNDENDNEKNLFIINIDGDSSFDALRTFLGSLGLEIPQGFVFPDDLPEIVSLF